MITVSHLCKKYGSHYAVRDLSFSLESGRIYGLLGPNGAGKSTTMNMITGYIPPTSGDVTVNGHNIRTESLEARRCIGYLPEIPPLYVDMTVREYLVTAAELKRIPRRERAQKVLQVMDKVMITDMKDRLIRNLSKGYRQRVGIAQAMLGDPQIIILDEPTVGLDPRQILEIRAVVKELKQEHTVIISSHILSEIAAICDDVLIMNGGRLVAAGSAAELEKKDQGRDTLELVAEGSEDMIRSLLGSMEGIRSFEIKKEEKDGDRHRAIVRLEDGRDIRRELFFGFAKKGLPILEMRNRQMSLEEVFLELTGSGTVGKEAES